MLPDNTSPTAYGPPLRNYDDVVDPETEISYEKIEALAVDVAGMTYTVPRAWAKVTAGGSPSVAAHGAVWGASSGVKPTVSSISTGICRLTWPATVDDLNPTASRQVSRSVSFNAASVTVLASTDLSAAPSYVNTTAAVSISGTAVTVGTGNGSAWVDCDFMLWVY